MSRVHFKLEILGKVQGVWYRASAQRKAQELGVTGIVRNEPDGSVYAEVEGHKQACLDFIAWCKTGPERADVVEVRVQSGAPKEYTDFNIERS